MTHQGIQVLLGDSFHLLPRDYFLAEYHGSGPQRRLLLCHLNNPVSDLVPIFICFQAVAAPEEGHAPVPAGGILPQHHCNDCPTSPSALDSFSTSDTAHFPAIHRNIIAHY